MPKKKKFDEVPEKQGDDNVHWKESERASKPVFHKDLTAPVTKPVAMTRENVIPQKDILSPVKPAVAIPAEKGNPYYKKTLWHNVKEVWQCSTCGVFRVTEEAAIAHILIHVPRDQHKTLQAQLTKEIKK